MSEYTNIFNERLPSQAEVCARKTLEWLQKDLQGEQKLAPDEIYHLTQAASLLLKMRDFYGEK
jgi:hypothetical protein